MSELPRQHRETQELGKRGSAHLTEGLTVPATIRRVVSVIRRQRSHERSKEGSDGPYDPNKMYAAPVGRVSGAKLNRIVADAERRYGPGTKVLF